MNRPLPSIKESAEALEILLKKQHSPRFRERIHALYLVQSSQATTRQGVAKLLGRHRRTISRWFDWYEGGGLSELLQIRTTPNKKPHLNKEEQAQLKARLEQPEGFGSYGEIQAWIEKTFGKSLRYATVHRMVRYGMNCTLKQAARSHIKKQEALTAHFKKTFLTILKSYVRPNSFEETRIFFQDESRFGLHTVTRRRITAKGVKPWMKYQMNFANYYLFGAIDPLRGDDFFLEMPALNTHTFQTFINALSQEYASSTNILILDGAAFHRSKDLVIPSNIRFLFLPPYSPELNPIERYWKHLKDQIAWNLFGGIEELKDKVATLIQNTSKQQIRSLTQAPFFINAVNGMF